MVAVLPCLWQEKTEGEKMNLQNNYINNFNKKTYLKSLELKEIKSAHRDIFFEDEDTFVFPEGITVSNAQYKY